MSAAGQLWFVHGRAATRMDLPSSLEGEPVYCELRLTGRKAPLSGRQRDLLARALKLLLQATAPYPVEANELYVGIGEFPQVDGDYEEGGDPGGKVMVP